MNSLLFLLSMWYVYRMWRVVHIFVTWMCKHMEASGLTLGVLMLTTFSVFRPMVSLNLKLIDSANWLASELQ